MSDNSSSENVINKSTYILNLDGGMFDNGVAVLCFKNTPLIAKLLTTDNEEKYFLCSDFAAAAQVLSGTNDMDMFNGLNEKIDGKDVYLAAKLKKTAKEWVSGITGELRGHRNSVSLSKISSDFRNKAVDSFKINDGTGLYYNGSVIINSSGSPRSSKQMLALAHSVSGVEYSDMTANVVEAKKLKCSM